jgi:putative ABC transport system permease protein
VFTAADHLLFRPLPYPNAGRVVTLWEVHRTSGERMEVSPGNYLDWENRSTVFEALGLAEPSGFDFAQPEGLPQPVSAWRVSRDFLSVLGVKPILGRALQHADFEPDASPVVLLSHQFWRERFGSSRDVVGESITLDEKPVTVIGVLPDWARYPGVRDVWAPRSPHPEEASDRSSSFMRAVALLRPGIGAPQAKADLDRVAGSIREDAPEGTPAPRIDAISLSEQIRGPLRLPLLTLFGAVLLLVLAACSNVAGLLLARGAERAREFGVRAALGASPARIIRQIVTEATLLALLGGVLGALLAYAGTSALALYGPPELSELGAPTIDVRVMTFGLLMMLAAAILSSLGPAIRASRVEPLPALSIGRGADSASRPDSKLRSALVVGQVSLAVVLLIGAGLLLQSFVRLRATDLGFSTEDRVSIQLFLWDRNETPAKRIVRVREIAERWRSMPGVLGVAAVSALPFHPHQIDARNTMNIDGVPEDAWGGERAAYTTVVTPEYFSVLGIPTAGGRVFHDDDRQESPKVVILNETAARRYFPGEDPVGRRVTVGVMGPRESREVVGVVGDVRPVDLQSPPRPEIYIPHSQSGTGSMTFVARSRHGSAITPMLLNALADIDPSQPVYHVATLPELVSSTLAERRFHLILLLGFSSLTLFLATLGTYSLVSYTTQRRTREIGIRVALGARPVDVSTLVLRQGLRVVLAGLALGVIAALIVTRFLTHMLYETQPTDPATIAAVGLLLLTTAGFAAYLPARRAARQSPATAIQFE